MSIGQNYISAMIMAKDLKKGTEKKVVYTAQAWCFITAFHFHRDKLVVCLSLVEQRSVKHYILSSVCLFLLCIPKTRLKQKVI